MPPLNSDAIPLDLDEVRRQLQGRNGRDYWRSLEELAGTEKFQEQVHREFPVEASVWNNAVSRRRFLMLMGASLGLAGLSGCGSRAPADKIVPYVKEPEGMTPGKPLFFATAMTLAGVATGLLVESHMGRPTKVEGNPEHPASLGATDSFAQASILDLYDPDREQTIAYLGKVRTWDETLEALRVKLADLKQKNEKEKRKPGDGLYFLTGAISSPTLAEQLSKVVGGKDYEGARWHQFEPTVSETPLAGARLAFDKDILPRYHIRKADVILSLDADFLSCGPGHLRYVREFSARRTGDPEKMNRLYVAESMFSTTGASADHHLPLRSDAIEGLARAIAAELKVPGIEGDAPSGTKHWVEVVARNLIKECAKGTTLVLAGAGQPPAVHALAHAMNEWLGNQGQTVVYTRPVTIASPTPGHSIQQLAQDMGAGKVEMLFILGGNPVFTAPADLDFLAKMDRVPLRIHLTSLFDETSARCHWLLPESHYLESWSDARAFDGTATIVQPLIAPLYDTRSAHELVSGLFDPSPLTGHELVRATWRTWWEGRKERSGTFETFWKTSLHDGVVKGSAFEPETVTLRKNFAEGLPAAGTPGKERELVFRPDPTLFDGRFANNGWLQELPKPLTRLTWDNAAIMSVQTAKDLGVTYRFGNRGGEHGEAYADMVTLTFEGRELTMPIWILPGHADDSITVHFGYGRKVAGKVGKNTGFNAYQLRTSARPWQGSGVTVTPVKGKQHLLACTQGHFNMEGRALVRSATVAEFKKDRDFATHPDGEHHAGKDKFGKAAGDQAPDEGKRKRKELTTLYSPHTYDGHKWGMVINLGACVGCGACVVACQAENNIPVVGKEEVSRGREMHWLRVDRYFKTSSQQHNDPLANPVLVKPEQVEAVHQPVPCMQCENAPCEQVCPVEATVHSFDGLNDMVYNRCVGTRYCSNNCPYKVRRFNFLQYADFTTPSLKLLHNPEVTVRSRGVMEKCTYCVQRLRAAEIVAQREDQPRVNGQNVSRIRDGEVQTACQAVCPAQAIVFGDLTGPDDSGKDGTKSRVAKLKESPLNYSLLAGLNTEPRTTYLAALRNPHPDLG